MVDMLKRGDLLLHYDDIYIVYELMPFNGVKIYKLINGYKTILYLPLHPPWRILPT